MKPWILGIVLVLIVIGCNSGNGTVVSPPRGNAVQVLVAVTGGRQVKRRGWTTYAPITVGSILRPGDALRLDRAAQATIVCTDLTVHSLAGGFEGSPCDGVGRVVLDYDGSLVEPARSTPQAASPFPILVMPRRTSLLNPHPTIRWLPVSGADGYEVAVVGTGVSWHTRVGADVTALVYPDDAPPLHPGGSYEITITAGGRSSSEERGGLGVVLVSSEQAAELHAHEQTIASLGLGEAQARLVRARLYASKGVFADAYEELVALPPAYREQEPAVVQFIGDVHTETLLNMLAEKRYQQALERARAANNLAGEALAERALGQGYETTGQSSEARAHLEAAVVRYRQLGDTAMVATLQERIERLPQE